MLVKAGARISCVNKNMQTPLHIASANNKGEIIEFLLDKGADIEKQDKVLNQLENKRKMVLDFISKGEKLLRTPYFKA